MNIGSYDSNKGGDKDNNDTIEDALSIWGDELDEGPLEGISETGTIAPSSAMRSQQIGLMNLTDGSANVLGEGGFSTALEITTSTTADQDYINIQSGSLNSQIEVVRKGSQRAEKHPNGEFTPISESSESKGLSVIPGRKYVAKILMRREYEKVKKRIDHKKKEIAQVTEEIRHLPIQDDGPITSMEEMTAFLQDLVTIDREVKIIEDNQRQMIREEIAHNKFTKKEFENAYHTYKSNRELVEESQKKGKDTSNMHYEFQDGHKFAELNLYCQYRFNKEKGVSTFNDLLKNYRKYKGKSSSKENEFDLYEKMKTLIESNKKILLETETIERQINQAYAKRKTAYSTYKFGGGVNDPEKAVHGIIENMPIQYGDIPIHANVCIEEIAAFGDLSLERLQRFETPAERMKLFQKIMQNVGKLHTGIGGSSRAFIHSDLKTENVLLSRRAFSQYNLIPESLYEEQAKLEGKNISENTKETISTALRNVLSFLLKSEPAAEVLQSQLTRGTLKKLQSISKGFLDLPSQEDPRFQKLTQELQDVLIPELDQIIKGKLLFELPMEDNKTFGEYLREKLNQEIGLPSPAKEGDEAFREANLLALSMLIPSAINHHPHFDTKLEEAPIEDITVSITDFDTIQEQGTHIKGLVNGTPEYVDPTLFEKVVNPGTKKKEFRSPDVKSDIYSLGCILFEMWSGKKNPQNAKQYLHLNPIVQKDNVGEIILELRDSMELRRTHAENSFVDLYKHIPAPIKEVIQKATHFDRKLRYKSVAAMEQDLIRAISEYESNKADYDQKIDDAIQPPTIEETRKIPAQVEQESTMQISQDEVETATPESISEKDQILLERFKNIQEESNLGAFIDELLHSDSEKVQQVGKEMKQIRDETDIQLPIPGIEDIQGDIDYYIQSSGDDIQKLSKSLNAVRRSIYNEVTNMKSKGYVENAYYEAISSLQDPLDIVIQNTDFKTAIVQEQERKLKNHLPLLEKELQRLEKLIVDKGGELESIAS